MDDESGESEYTEYINMRSKANSYNQRYYTFFAKLKNNLFGITNRIQMGGRLFGERWQSPRSVVATGSVLLFAVWLLFRRLFARRRVFVGRLRRLRTLLRTGQFCTTSTQKNVAVAHTRGR